MPNAEFVLVGDGPLRPELENEASSLGLGASAIFLGDRQDMPAVLASLDVAVLTSDSESLSNVILEAMAAGLPVVAYSVGGNSELVSDQRGALFPRATKPPLPMRSSTFLPTPHFASNRAATPAVRGRKLQP